MRKKANKKAKITADLVASIKLKKLMHGIQSLTEQERTIFDRYDFDPGVDPYADTVQRSVHYLMSELRQQEIGPQSGGDPDSNGNGYALYAGKSTYEAALTAMALTNSAAPEATAPLGNSFIISKAFTVLSQDSVPTHIRI